MSVHITENSLRRIAQAPVVVDARIWACTPDAVRWTFSWHEEAVVVDEGFEMGRKIFEIDNVALVTCPTCRVLVDAALERRVSVIDAAVAP